MVVLDRDEAKIEERNRDVDNENRKGWDEKRRRGRYRILFRGENGGGGCRERQKSSDYFLEKPLQLPSLALASLLYPKLTLR